MKTLLVIIFCVVVSGCSGCTNQRQELVRLAFDAGWWCSESGKSHEQCTAELNSLPSMQ